MDPLGRLAAEIRSGLIESRRASPEGTEEGIGEAIRREVEKRAIMLSPEAREELVGGILREASGLGPLEELLEDGSVEEVMVNGPDLVYVERAGRIEPAGVTFEDEEQLAPAPLRPGTGQRQPLRQLLQLFFRIALLLELVAREP